MKHWITPDGNYYYGLHVAEGSVEIDAKPLELVRAEKWLEIKVARDSRKSRGVKVNIGGVDYWFHTEDRDVIQYGTLDRKAARLILGDAVVLHPSWKTMSGAKIPMTVGIVRQILDAGVTQEAALYEAAEIHKSAMEAESDPSSYNFSGGWPATFDGQ